MDSNAARSAINPYIEHLKQQLIASVKLEQQQARELALFIDAEVTPLAAEFLATSDERHLDVLKFRIGTRLRTMNVEALKAKDALITEAIITGIRAASGLILSLV